MLSTWTAVFDDVEILQRGPHHEGAFAVIEENALGGVEVHAHAHEELTDSQPDAYPCRWCG